MRRMRTGRRWLLLGTVFAGIAALVAVSFLLVQVGKAAANAIIPGGTCYTVGPKDPREYRKPACEDQSGLTNIDTVGKMLTHFGVTLPAGARNLQFQVEDDSTWNGGTQLALYLQFSMPEAGLARFLAADHASPSTDLLLLGVTSDEIQLGPVWYAIAESDYSGLHPYEWGTSSGGGALFVRDGAGSGEPTLYLSAGSESY